MNGWIKEEEAGDALKARRDRDHERGMREKSLLLL